MTRSAWTWLWFALAAILIFVTLGYGGKIDGNRRSIAVFSRSREASIPGSRYFVDDLKRQNTIAEKKVALFVVLASLSLGTGLRARYRFSILRAYGTAFLICPLCAVAFPFGLLALRNLS